MIFKDFQVTRQA